MVTPYVVERLKPLRALDRDDFGDEPSSPRRPPYDRAAQREMVRRSLDFETHCNVYYRKAKP
jgi:hypothetical protein